MVARTRPTKIQVVVRISALREGSRHRVQPLTKKLSAIDTCWQRENEFSPVYSQAHFRAEPMPKSSWPMQN